MKKVVCGTCNEKFEGSTSHILKALEQAHYDACGHRHFRGVLGMGNHSFEPHPGFPGVDLRPVEWSPEESMEMRSDYLTVEELDAALRAHPTHKELVTWKKELATMELVKREVDLLQQWIRTLEKQSVPVAPRDDAAVKKAVASVEKRFAAQEQSLAGVKEVLNRFKAMEKDGFPARLPSGLVMQDAMKAELNALCVALAEGIDEKTEAVRLELHESNARINQARLEETDTMYQEMREQFMQQLEALNDRLDAGPVSGDSSGDAGFLMDASGEQAFTVSGHIGAARPGDWVVGVASGGGFIASQVRKPTTMMRVHLQRMSFNASDLDAMEVGLRA